MVVTLMYERNLMQQKIRDKSISISTDSLNMLKVFKNLYITSLLDKQTKQVLNKLAKVNKIVWMIKIMRKWTTSKTRYYPDRVLFQDGYNAIEGILKEEKLKTWNNFHGDN